MWPIVNVAGVYLLRRTLMATTATKSFPLLPAKANALAGTRNRNAGARQFGVSQNGGKEIPCRVRRRPNKNVARKCRYAGGRTMQMGRRCRAAAASTSREIFAILVFTLSLTLKIWNCFADGWRMAVRLRWNFKAKNVRERGCNYRRIKHGYAVNKFTLGAENAGKEFITSHSILLMPECY